MSESGFGTESVFWFCAIAGSAFFGIKVLLNLVGGFGVNGHDFHDGAGGADHHDGPDAHGTEVAFKLMSLTSIGAFIMMFGWIGLACYSQYSLGSGISILLAFLGGVLTMVLIAYIFYGASKLTSGGAVLDLKTLMGATATVYQRIPAGGRGVIQISADGVLREFDATSEDLSEIESFSKVSVERIIDSKTLGVKRVN